MFPRSAGQPQKDWMQILIAVVWFTVVAIMLLAKMKAITDVLVLGFLLIATGVQNCQLLLPWLFDRGESKRVATNLIALRNHLQWEAFWTAVLSFFVFFLAAQESCSWIHFGWVFQVTTLCIHFFARNNRWHLNPVITLSTYMAVRNRKALTEIQMRLYVGFQVAGIIMAFLLHSVALSRGEELSFFHTLEPNGVALLECVVAAGIGYTITYAMVRRKEVEKSL